MSELNTSLPIPFFIARPDWSVLVRLGPSSEFVSHDPLNSAGLSKPPTTRAR